MCELVFEVQGKTENYVRLKKDGHGIKFLGNNLYLDHLYLKNEITTLHICLSQYSAVDYITTLQNSLSVLFYRLIFLCIFLSCNSQKST